MSSEDLIDLDGSGHSSSDSQKKKLHHSDTEPCESNPQHNSSLLKEDTINEEILGAGEGDSGKADGEHVQEMELDKDLVGNPTIRQEGVNLTETVTVADKAKEVNYVNSEKGCEIAQEDSAIINHHIDDSSVLGVKRARTTYVGHESSVHVKYNFLTRASKRKLEELLQQWSEWHARHGLSNDSNISLECGEETLFPALYVGQEKTSTVSFWMDKQASRETNKFVPLDGDLVPFYDRGYALGLTSADGSTNQEGGMESREASRCFNCGSYSHSLRECPKPRDNAAVDNARKQHNSKRGHNSGPRNQTRYYQDSSGGKYDGLKPGYLGSELRKLLGIEEFDPPPWLHRMRQIGYPLGYLEAEEDQSSGITIFGNEETKEEQEGGGEDGEILEIDNPEPKMKQTVEFPGINAPIPEKADPRRWQSPEASSFDLSRNRFHSMSPRSSDPNSRPHYSDHRRSGDYRYDGPPGCSPGVDSHVSAYGQRYGGYDLNYASESQSPRLNPIPRSPNLGRSLSDRGRRSPLSYEGSPSYSPRNNLSYSSPNICPSPQNYASPNYERWNPGGNHNLSPDFSSHRHRHEQHHQRKR